MKDDDTKLVVLGNLFYYGLWKDKSAILKTLYVLIPVNIMSLFIYMLIVSGFGHVEGINGYGFLDDYANKYVVFGAFGFAYFASGLFIPHMRQQIENLLKNVSYEVREKIGYHKEKVEYGIEVASVVIMGLSALFISVAYSQGEKNWYSCLPKLGFAFYVLLVVWCWRMTTKLFLLIIYYNYCLIECFKYPLENIDYYNRDKCLGYKKLMQTIAMCLGFGIYFLVLVGIISLSDYRAYTEFHQELGFYKYRGVLIFLIPTMATVYCVSIVLAYRSLKNQLNARLEEKIEGLKLFTNERLFLEKCKITIFKFSNLMTFVSTIVVPIVSAIVAVI